MNDDAFALNIEGVRDLVSSGMNKTEMEPSEQEGVSGEYVDYLELPMSNEELLDLKDKWEGMDAAYSPKIKPRQDKNKIYYLGKQKATGEADTVVSSNLIFEAEETFIPQALSKNPEPVVWSDNTDEGKQESNDLKTMLQFHADTLCLRKKLGVMIRHHGIYFLAVVKHGWDAKVKEIKTEVRKPQNFLFDKDAYIDEYGNYIGEFLGERMPVTAKKLCDLFPKHKDYITLKVDGKMGTQLRYTEWWTDEYCFSTYEDVILDKHKNEFFNYDQAEKKNDEGNIIQSATPGQNHFAIPKMPYTFLSVFSLQEQPHDVTNLIEQNIANQNRINDRDDQISRNLATGNNSIALSGISFNSETAHQAAMALENGDPVLVPDGQVENAIKRIPANNLPSAIFEAQNNDKETLRSIFGTLGLTTQPQNEDTTARGMILNQSHDSSRIGGGIGDALEQVADNIFNWWVQLYYVFYDEPHYASVMGNGRAVEYVQILNSNLNRRFVVSVAPNSMQPKDEITEQNLAIELANSGWLDPINLFKKLNYPDPMETAKMVTLYKINPQMYMQQFFPEQPQSPIQQPQGNPPDMQAQPGSPPPQLSQPAASPALSNVPINSLATPK